MTGAAAHYIISPKIIYLIHLAQGIKNFLGMILLIGGFIIGFATWYIIFGHDYFDVEFDVEEEKAVKKYYFKSIIVFIILCLIQIAIPNKETCTQMLVASYVTEENVAAAQDNLKEVIDYIFEKVNEGTKKDADSD